MRATPILRWATVYRPRVRITETGVYERDEPEAELQQWWVSGDEPDNSESGEWRPVK